MNRTDDMTYHILGRFTFFSGRTSLSTDTDIAIVGGGPYALSLAAHLRGRGRDYRVFGSAMRAWVDQMPKGMLLKSEGFASDLYDAEGYFTLRRFCQERGIAYADVGVPVSLDTFVSYGLAFQRKYIPNLENRMLSRLERNHSEFRLRFEDGASVRARKVVLATGLNYFRRIPKQLATLPATFVSHSADHSESARFRSRNVTVIGAGASAVDLAVLLSESGADVRIVARRPSIEINTDTNILRPLWERMVRPTTVLGEASWRLALYCAVPSTFRYLPDKVRLQKVETTFGPAAGWFMRDRMNGVDCHVGLNLREAEVSQGQLKLIFVKNDGTKQKLTTDHVIAATGYKVDLRCLPYLSDEIRSQIKSIEHSPVLSSRFQSSVTGLYFVGPASASSFGPIMRFAAGAKFTAKRLSTHLSQT
jgi:thioredoxin reductase